MSNEQPAQSMHIVIYYCIIIFLSLWFTARLALSSSKSATVEADRTGPATSAANSRAKPHSAPTVIDYTNSVPDLNKAQKTPAPSYQSPRPSSGRKYRDSSGSIIDECVAEEKLRELRDSIDDMPEGHRRESYRRALRLCEDEWDRIKRRGPIE